MQFIDAALHPQYIHTEDVVMEDRGVPLRLTLREQQVHKMALEGKPAKEIACGLTISPRTVKFHLGSIYRKVG